MPDAPSSSDGDHLALVLEVFELRQQLAAAQDLLVETAIDAGQLHVRMEALQNEMADLRADRDRWRAEAQSRGRAVA